MSAWVRTPVRQRGAALLALLAVVVLAFAYLLTSRLHSAAGRTVVDREHNARVLAQAKQALIGWMVLNAAQTDNNPGRLPCPEGINSVGTASEGIAAPTVTPATPNCATVGRLPWRTLGLDKLVDAHAEPLWYAVSPGWRLQNSSTLLRLNSDSLGAMAVDAQAAPNEVVALIIAPGPAMNVLAAPGCTARFQVRMPPAPAMDPRDYLECFDAATPAFSTVGPAASFNDQVLKVTTADLLPALEAAVAHRMQREIAPALKSVYASAQWGTSAANPLFAFAAPFANPGGSSYQGADGSYQGLLPFTCSTVGCDPGARHSPNFVTWNTASTPTVSVTGIGLGSGTCAFAPPSTVQCNGTYVMAGNATLRMQVQANNVAMALRQLDPSSITVRHGLVTCGSPAPGTAASGTLQSDGSANLTLEGTAPGLVGGPPFFLPLTVQFCMTANLGVLADHPLLNASDPTTGWFVRNEWYRLVYYAAAPTSTADGLPTYGCNATNCLRFKEPTVTRNIRALLVLTGRSLNNPAGRPSATLSDYLEFENCNFSVAVTDCVPNSLFEQRPIRSSKVALAPINAPWNDRVILVDWIAPNPTFPLPWLP